MRRALIIGCGYTGLRLAGRLRQQGFAVTGTTRGPQRADVLRAAGTDVLDGALDDAVMLARLGALAPAIVVYLVPPQADVRDPLPGVLAAFRAAPPESFVYASSTSVYGDRQGDWVDEETPLVDDGAADVRRIEAERLVLEAARRDGLPTRVCRISGIYGPGRTLRPLLQSGRYHLIAGRDPWVGRIHVDDLVSGIVAAALRGADCMVYNMVDRRPHLASEFANLAADLQGFVRPPRISPAEAAGRYSDAEFRRKTSSKRIRCGRLVDDLRVELRYPSFEHGLPAAVAEDQELK